MSAQQNMETAGEAIEFVSSECGRLQKLIIPNARTLQERFSRLTPADMMCTIPLPGHRELFCGPAAYRRLQRLAAHSISNTDAAGTVETNRVFEALRRRLGNAIAESNGSLDDAAIPTLIADAINEAKAAREDRIHFIPCRLMVANQPDVFQIGPVTFRALEMFNQKIDPLYTACLANDPPEQRERSAALLDQARHYYDGFGWVGEVKVLNCDPKTSEARARQAVTAAVNILHLLFGAFHTDQMMVGGPRMPDDRRAHLYLDDKGELQVSCSWNTTSALGFQDGWIQHFRRADFQFLLHAANKAIEPLVNPAMQRPLATRFIEAASWYGDAVREESSAARIVKAANALEHAFATGRGKGITKRLSTRAAAVCYDRHGEKSFAGLVAEFVAAYDLRSDLVHGRRSPFDPEVEEQCAGIMELAETALCNLLAFYDASGLLDRPSTNKERARGFDRLIASMQMLDSKRKDIAA